MPAGRAHGPNTALATTRATWETMRGSILNSNRSRTPWGRRGRTHGACPTCTGTLISGVKTGMTASTMRIPRWRIQQDLQQSLPTRGAKRNSPEEVESLLKKSLPGIRKIADHAQKASWSPEGDRIVCSKSGDLGLEIVHVNSGVKTDLIAPGKDAAWSPGDGRLIAFVKGSDEGEELWLVDSTGKHPRKLADGGFPSWSGDGKRLFLQSRKTRKLQVVRFQPEPSPPVDVCAMPFEYPAVSWDGETVAYWDNRLLNIIDLKSGTDVRSFRLPFPAPSLMGWSPDGKQVGFGPYIKFPGIMGLYIVNLETGIVVQAAEGEYTRPAWSRDGLKLAFDRRDNGLEEIWTVETRTLAGIKPFKAKTPAVPEPLLAANRVYRGSGWYTPSQSCRSAARFFREPDYGAAYLGFRVCQVLAVKD